MSRNLFSITMLQKQYLFYIHVSLVGSLELPGSLGLRHDRILVRFINAAGSYSLHEEARSRAGLGGKPLELVR